jgi:hypothetical protein
LSLPSNSITTLLWAAAGLLLFLLLVMGWGWARSRRSQPPPGTPVVDWHGRVVAAEQRAVQAEQVVKAGLLPHLARLLRAKLVVALLRQRRELVAGQEAGTEKAEDLERRLASVQEEIRRKLETSAANSKAPKAVGVAAPGSGPAAPQTPRRNPLIERRPVVSEPVRFNELLARRRQVKAPAASDAKADGSEPDSGSPKASG